MQGTPPPPKPAMRNDLMRSFGRVKGRKLRKEQNFLIENILPNISIDINTPVSLPILFKEEITNFCLEIGFGRGEHLAEFAKRNPHIGCIGCEPFINGVAGLLKHVNDDNINNIRVFHGDARLLLDKLPENNFDKIFILFPDPWPKSKHHKKRIISHLMLNCLAKTIKNGGVLEIASDHAGYNEWIAQHLENHSSFEESPITKGKRLTPPSDWIKTRYQEKAEQNGRKATFFNFTCKKQYNRSK